MTPGPPALQRQRRSKMLQQRSSTGERLAVPPRRRRRLQTVPARELQRRAVLPAHTAPLPARCTAAPRRCCQAGAAEEEPQVLRSLRRRSGRACAPPVLSVEDREGGDV